MFFTGQNHQFRHMPCRPGNKKCNLVRKARMGNGHTGKATRNTLYKGLVQKMGDEQSLEQDGIKGQLLTQALLEKKPGFILQNIFRGDSFFCHTKRKIPSMCGVRPCENWTSWHSTKWGSLSGFSAMPLKTTTMKPDCKVVLWKGDLFDLEEP